MPWISQDDSINMGNVIKIMSLRPKAMQAVMDVNQAVTFGGSALTRVQEEAIATAVSVINRCRY
ncbi:MAG: carboxymuconolactone decarboxylase family protein [Chloroflexi bacterium]|nr:carboxymuconolactone decarboxylase family protein [Chloroflexota bacterium]MCH8870492.1 carboxymuconolactone decarboxylase family protein [Chloroflexota bacterium]